MLALFLAVMAAAWLIEAAVTDDNLSRNSRGAVAFIRTGERTPVLAGGSGSLSALGVQQMHVLGQMLRGRYIGDTLYDGLGHDPIKGLAPNILNVDQLHIRTQETPYLQASALAFMQGFYPPYQGNTTEPIALGNSSTEDHLLAGYQFAPIQTTGELDPDSIYIAGGDNCPVAKQESRMYHVSDEYIETREETKEFYQGLDPALFDGHLKKSYLDYYNAIEIYDYLSYAYEHNQTVRDALDSNANTGVLDTLHYYADEAAWYTWGNASSPSEDTKYRAMPGRTLAALILGQLQRVVAMKKPDNTTPNTLTLLFGEHEPFLSLFSLLLLDAHSTNFKAIPPYASAMIFEVFSTSKTDNPTPNDTWVNFFFQNGTDYAGDMTSYPVFGNGPSRTDMPWLDFEDMMMRVMTNALSEWCTQCESPAQFCLGVYDTPLYLPIQGQAGRKGLAPAVAGVVGAVVTLAVAGLLVMGAMVLGGIRFHRVQRGGGKAHMGGFKGSAKLASDADLSLAGNAAVPAGAGAVVGAGGEDAARKPGHERVGSWELRQKEGGGNGDMGDMGDMGSVRERESFEAIEAAMNRPVEPNVRV